MQPVPYNIDDIMKELDGFVIHPGTNSLLSLPIQFIEGIHRISAISRTPDQQIVINGAAQVIPGREIKHDIWFEPREGGCVMNENDEIERDFFIVKISTLQQGEVQQVTEVAIYYDEDIKTQIKEVFAQN